MYDAGFVAAFHGGRFGVCFYNLSLGHKKKVKSKKIFDFSEVFNSIFTIKLIPKSL